MIGGVASMPKKKGRAKKRVASAVCCVVCELPIEPASAAVLGYIEGETWCKECVGWAESEEVLAEEVDSDEEEKWAAGADNSDAPQAMQKEMVVEEGQSAGDKLKLPTPWGQEAEIEIPAGKVPGDKYIVEVALPPGAVPPPNRGGRGRGRVRRAAAVASATNFMVLWLQADGCRASLLSPAQLQATHAAAAAAAVAAAKEKDKKEEVARVRQKAAGASEEELRALLQETLGKQLEADGSPATFDTASMSTDELAKLTRAALEGEEEVEEEHAMYELPPEKVLSAFDGATMLLANPSYWATLCFGGGAATPGELAAEGVRPGGSDWRAHTAADTDTDIARRRAAGGTFVWASRFLSGGPSAGGAAIVGLAAAPSMAAVGVTQFAFAGAQADWRWLEAEGCLGPHAGFARKDAVCERNAAALRAALRSPSSSGSSSSSSSSSSSGLRGAVPDFSSLHAHSPRLVREFVPLAVALLLGREDWLGAAERRCLRAFGALRLLLAEGKRTTAAAGRLGPGESRQPEQGGADLEPALLPLFKAALFLPTNPACCHGLCPPRLARRGVAAAASPAMVAAGTGWPTDAIAAAHAGALAAHWSAQTPAQSLPSLAYEVARCWVGADSTSLRGSMGGGGGPRVHSRAPSNGDNSEDGDGGGEGAMATSLLLELITAMARGGEGAEALLLVLTALGKGRLAYVAEEGALTAQEAAAVEGARERMAAVGYGVHHLDVAEELLRKQGVLPAAGRAVLFRARVLTRHVAKVAAAERATAPAEWESPAAWRMRAPPMLLYGSGHPLAASRSAANDAGGAAGGGAKAAAAAAAGQTPHDRAARGEEKRALAARRAELLLAQQELEAGRAEQDAAAERRRADAAATRFAYAGPSSKHAPRGKLREVRARRERLYQQVEAGDAAGVRHTLLATLGTGAGAATRAQFGGDGEAAALFFEGTENGMNMSQVRLLARHD